MAQGRADWRRSRRTGNWRARFYEVHEDERELILDALKKARGEAGTNYDTHALSMICLSYLADSPYKLAQIFARLKSEEKPLNDNDPTCRRRV
jgi:hypothetical protein